jgi:hypothetical protein
VSPRPGRTRLRNGVLINNSLHVHPRLTSAGRVTEPPTDTVVREASMVGQHPAWTVTMLAKHGE